MKSDPLRPDESDPHVIDCGRIEALETDLSGNTVRTVVRLIDCYALTADELNELNRQRLAFGQERARFIWLLKSREYRRYCYGTGYRTIRDKLVKEDQAARKQGMNAEALHFGLQGRQWKMALQSASIVVSNYWRLVQQSVRSTIFTKPWTQRLNETERAYIRMILSCLRPEFFDLLDGSLPAFSKLKMEEISNLKRLCRKLLRAVRKAEGTYPSPGKPVSVWFDQDCYKVLDEKDGQYVSIMSMKRGKRIRVKLLGAGKVKSTIRLIFREDGSLALHVMKPLQTKPMENVPSVPKGKLYCRAFDMGVTEVFTDDEGRHYGKGFGKLLSKGAETLSRKMAARSRLAAIARNTNSKAKRRRILRFNLGSKRFLALKQLIKTQIRCHVNKALNEMMREAPASAYIVEELSELFVLGDKLSRRTKRLLSGWIRGIIGERLAFKAAERGVKLAKAAPSYSSQTCPKCLYADRKNRSGDRFKCLSCESLFQSDLVGAANLLYRAGRDGWQRRMTREKAWAQSRREYEALCRANGAAPKPDPHRSRKGT